MLAITSTCATTEARPDRARGSRRRVGAGILPVMRGVARVLKPTGSLWLNLGDSYSRHARYGAPPKSLLLAPERLLLALLSEGWIVRNRVAWVKPNSMPSSVADRLTCRWEVIYMLTRARATTSTWTRSRIPHRSTGRSPSKRTAMGYPPPSASPPSWGGPLAASHTGLDRLKASGSSDIRSARTPATRGRSRSRTSAASTSRPSPRPSSHPAAGDVPRAHLQSMRQALGARSATAEARGTATGLPLQEGLAARPRARPILRIRHRRGRRRTAQPRLARDRTEPRVRPHRTQRIIAARTKPARTGRTSSQARATHGRVAP